ncbi:hypothetical protein LWI28_019759 [Acer negundo]|uniref:Uncharacterized protein n=1 Tax=Acer negundo TaxID=4023 RepID=A0AAD5JMM7_ACENE|nr:hypothetical protein LWI28_019759 [Acer negundo]
MKVGDTLCKKSTTSNQNNDKVCEEDCDGEFLFEQVKKSDVQADATGNYTVTEADAVTKSHGLASKSDVDKHSSDPQADALADSKMVECCRLYAEPWEQASLSDSLQPNNSSATTGGSEENPADFHIQAQATEVHS